ncbi:MAG: ParB N-terminal domain-containing protein [Syntrophorhabdaceae bacterium]
MKIDEIIIGKRYRKELGDMDLLKQSIRELGLLHPIILRKGTKELIAGYRRFCVLKEMGTTDLVEGVHVSFIDIESIVRGEYDENICRKDFTISEKVAIFDAVKEEQLRLSLARQILAGCDTPARPREPDGKKPANNTQKKVYGEARYQAAQAVGLHQNTLRKAGEIVRAARQEPQKYGHLVKEMDTTGKVDPIFQKYMQEKLRPMTLTELCPELARLSADPGSRVPEFLVDAMSRLTLDHQDELVRFYRDILPEVKRSDFERSLKTISKANAIGELTQDTAYEFLKHILEYTRLISQEWMFLPQVRQVASLIMSVAKANETATILDKLDFFMIGLAGFVDMTCNYLKVANTEGILESLPENVLEKYLAAIDAFQMLYESKLPRQVGAMRLKEKEREERSSGPTIRDHANAMKANEMITDAAEGNIRYYKNQIAGLIQSFREGANRLKSPGTA